VSDRDRDLQWYRCGVHVARIAAEHTEDAALLRARLVEEIRRNLYPGGGPWSRSSGSSRGRTSDADAAQGRVRPQRRARRRGTADDRDVRQR
jgi:hypothetical protein